MKYYEHLLGDFCHGLLSLTGLHPHEQHLRQFGAKKTGVHSIVQSELANAGILIQTEE